MPSRRIPFSVHISYLFVGLLLAYAAISSVFQYRETRRLITAEVGQRYALIGQQAIGALQNLYRPAAMSTALLARQPLKEATSLEQRLDSLAWLTTALNEQPSANSMYFGYPGGDFFLLRRWRDNPQLQALFHPPAGTAWIVQSIQRSNATMRGEHLFFDAALRLIERRSKPDYRFDPRQRDWYIRTLANPGLYVTQPYLFASTGEAGLTFAKAADDGKGVAGLDITLHSLSRVLMASKVTPDTRIVLLNEDRQVLGSHLGPALLVPTPDGRGRLPQLADFKLPMLEKLMGETPASGAAFKSFEDAQGNDWEGGPIRLPEFGGSRLTLWIASPHAELLAGALTSLQRSIYIVLGLLLAGVLAALGLSRLASRPLAGLTREAGKIQRFDFDEAVEVESQIAEVVDLAEAMGSMKGTIKRFLQLSTALASETNFNSLLARLLREMQAVTGADASLIYLADADASHLELARVLQGSSLLDGHGLQVLVTGEEPEHPLLQGLDERLPPRALSVEELQTCFPALREIAHGLTLWVLPLRNRDGVLLGALALLVDTQRHTLGKALMAFVRTLSATAAIALNTQRLIEEQKILLESFIELIAGAIDSKSPYTGGHCQRVPELTKMLARAACAEQQGPFAGFALSAEQWEELHIAAWLHDCGKVTTPEYVVDKATKLETLYDRIHEVRMRFEVLKRDAEIACLKACAAGGDSAALQAGLAEQLQQLDADFAFVAQCNEGGESITAEQLERLQALGRRSWTRTLSDRLGISYEERQRKQHSPEAALPVGEPLLADKPEHLFPRREQDSLAANNPWGFKVGVPEYLYNRGELYNLCVPRGTLSAEERFKINEHIIQTIIMLEKLPFPRHLRRVPEIAGGHHEKMDGSGYPKRLTREQMSVPARMMAIADIFEALTAIDRPYKKGKLLSEAIHIMARMRQEQHIDPELFELFLRSGVYREYAERYLQPEQIDAVDIQPYLS